MFFGKLLSPNKPRPNTRMGSVFPVAALIMLMQRPPAADLVSKCGRQCPVHETASASCVQMSEIVAASMARLRVERLFEQVQLTTQAVWSIDGFEI